METVKSRLLMRCTLLNLRLLPTFCSQPGSRASWWALSLTALGFFAFSPLCLAHDGGHMSGQNNQGPPSHHEEYYSDPFWGGWYPGYAGGYDSDYSYTPTPVQATTAQKRVTEYLIAVRKGRRHAATHRYIAVETLRPTKKQLEDYQKKLENAKSASASAGPQMSNRWVPPSQLRCLMVFDTESKQFVGAGCYVIGSLPPVGTISKFDTFSAEFVGTQAL
jgi:hypothetical protein